jgi:hypothetical protein
MLSGTTYVVDSLGDVVAGDNVVTLREAIEAANTNLAVTEDVLAGRADDVDHITFDRAALSIEAGVDLGEPLTIVLGGTQLEITDDLHIEGLGADALTIDANELSRVMHVVGETIEVSLTGLTLTGGLVEANGAGIYNEAATLTLSDCTVFANTGAGYSADGGGVCNDAGMMTLTDSSIRQNKARFGGGICNLDGSLVVTRLTASDNRGTYGGAIHNDSGVMTLADSLVTRNSAGWYGAGIYSDEGAVTLTDSTVSDNETTSSSSCGGGIYADHAALMLSGSTVSGNLTSEDGGGIWAISKKVTLNRSAILRNCAGENGGGIYATGLGELMIMADTVVADNEARVSGGGVYIHSGLTVTNSTVTGNVAIEGGGLYTRRGKLTLTNSTVFGNKAIDNGGGVDGHDIPNGVRLNNAIVANNTRGPVEGDDVRGILDPASSHNLIGDANSSGGLLDGVHGNIVGADALLTPVTTRDGSSVLYYVPRVDSPAIGGGSNNFAVGPDGSPLTLDQAGWARVARGVVDIGSVERPVTPELLITPASPVDLGEGDSVELSVSLLAAPSEPMTVSVSKLPGGASSVSADVSSLAFDETNWDIAQAVTIEADRDPQRADQSASFELSASGILSRRLAVTAHDWAHYVVDTVEDVIAPDGQLSLREAVEAANTNARVHEAVAGSATGVDLITFDPSLAGSTILLNEPGLVIADHLVLRGLGAGEMGTTINGNRDVRPFDIESNITVAIEDLTIFNGWGTGSGNTQGGAVRNTGRLTLTNCSVVGNRADLGGAMYNDTGTLTLRDCTVTGNHGGIYNDSGVLALMHSTLSGNLGEGIYNTGRATLVNCTVVGNRSGRTTRDSGGGGICNYRGRLSLTNCTVAGNDVFFDGGGIYNRATLALTNTIVALNHAHISPDVHGDYVSHSSLVGVDPGFVRDPSPGEDGEWATEDDDYGDLRLIDTSLAINLGDPALAASDDGLLLVTDRNGDPRVVDGRVDIGAYEYQGAPSPLRESPAAVVTTLEDVVDGADGETSLREACVHGVVLEQDVTFAPHLSDATIRLVGGPLYLDRSLTIDAYATDGLTLNAAGESRVLQVAGPDTHVSLIGLTLTGGRAMYLGGGVHNHSDLTLRDSTVWANSVADGSGGGVYNHRGTLTLENSTAWENSASGHGGAIYNDNGTVTLTNSTLWGNRGSHGGGIYNLRGTLILTNATVSGNEAEVRGTGIFDFSNGVLILNNTLVAGNHHPSGARYDLYAYDTDVQGDYNLTSGRSYDWAAGQGEHNLVIDSDDPRLMPLGRVQGFTPLPLLRSDSPAIDAGGTSDQAWDQRGEGHPRVVGEAVDIGAHEYSDTLAIVTEAGPAEVQEGLETQWSVWLSNQPLDTVTVAIAHTQGDPSIHVDPAELVFTPDDWDVPQSVTFRADFDADAEDGAAIFELTSPATETHSLWVHSLERQVYVVNTLDDSVEVDGLVSLREALDASNQAFSSDDVPLGRDDRIDLILFDASLDGGTIFLGGTTLAILDDVEIQGPGADSLAIDAGEASYVLDVESDTSLLETNEVEATIRGLTFAGGDRNGIYNSLSALTLTQCAIVGTDGNGVRNHEGSLVLEDSIVADNDGSGVYNQSGTVLVTGSTIMRNTTSGDGAGIYNAGTLAMVNAKLLGNRGRGSSSSRGGGIYNYRGTIDLLNVIVSGNWARGSGGGIRSTGPATLTNCTIVGNLAKYNGGISASSEPATLNNTFVGLNEAQSNSDVDGDIIYRNSLVGVDPGFIRNPWWGEDEEWGTPDDDYGDLRILLETSPLVDAGDNALLPSDDLDLDADADTDEPLPIDVEGNPRIHSGAVDIGAYEYPSYSVIAGRYVFYNHCALDGDDLDPNAADDNAIDATRHALLPGETPCPENCTRYSRGLNGIMIDVVRLPASAQLRSEDFRVLVSDIGGWVEGPQPAGISIRRGAGAGGSDRVTLVWDDGAVAATWLRVTVLPTERTRLAGPDVFIFGSLPGDLDGNGVVSDADYTLWADHYGRSEAADLQAADLNLDGAVSDADYTAWADHYGKSLGDPPTGMAGDADGDGAITDADYTIWADNYNAATDLGHEVGDFNDSGAVTDADYTVWADHYGVDTGAAVATAADLAPAVVEPAYETLQTPVSSAPVKPAAVVARPTQPTPPPLPVALGVMGPLQHPADSPTVPGEVTLGDDSAWTDDDPAEIDDLLAILSAPELL